MKKLSKQIAMLLMRPLVTLGMLMSITQFSLAEWREDIGVFRIGIVTQGDTAGTLARSEPFRSAIADKLDMDVEFFPASTIESVLDALKDDRIEYAMLSASGFSLINSLCECVEPLAIPRAADSSDAYHLIAIARYGENQTVDALPQKRVGILSDGAAMGEALVRYLLEKEQPELDIQSLRFESKPTSQETEDSFLAKEYDVLFGWSSLNGDPSDGFGRGTLRRLVEKSGDLDVAYEVVWKSPPIPHRPHVVRKKLPGEAKNLLRDLLVNLFDRNPVAYDSIEPVYGGGFAAARTSRFQTLTTFFEQYKKRGTEETPSPEPEAPE